MNRSLFFTIATGLLIFAAAFGLRGRLASVQSAKDFASRGQDKQAEAKDLSEDLVRLGMVAPLTGDFAPYGQQVRKGIELALSELKSKGIIAQITYEDACLPQEVRTSVHKLINTNKIHAVVGSYCVIGMVASKSLLEEAKVISFQTSGGTKEILNPEQYLFTTSSRTIDEANKLAEYAFNDLHLRRAGILYLETQWGEEFSSSFESKFKELGGIITGKSANRIGESNFRSEITRVQAGKPDALVIAHLGGILGTAITQVRDLGFENQILVSSDAEDKSVTDFAKEKAEGIKFLTPETFDAMDTVKVFRENYVSKFKEEPTPLARHSYDATMLATNALIKCNRHTECAKDEINKTKVYHGASGEFSIDVDGGTARKFIVKTVKNEKFVETKSQS